MHRRRLLIVAAIACWMQACSAYAQIAVEPEYEPGDIIQPRYVGQPLEGAKSAFVWSCDTAPVVTFSGGEVVVGSKPGEHLLKLDVTHTLTIPVVDKDDPAKWTPRDLVLPPYHYEAVVRVNGVSPTPPSKTLAELAGGKAKALGTLYAGLAAQVESIKTAAIFKAAHAKLLADQGLTGHGATAAIDKRLAAVLVDPLDHAKLRSVLEAFVAELGSLPPPTTTATAVTYVYEKDQGGVPAAVSAGLSELNTATLRATTFEEDTTDADGDTPDQYQAALKAAKEAGLPALVVTAGATVLRVIKSPTTIEQVREAVR